MKITSIATRSLNRHTFEWRVAFFIYTEGKMEDNLKYLNVDDLIPYENNPRDNEEAVDYVAKSIEEFGFKVPIVIDKHNIVVAGHTRLKASKQLGLEKVPVIIADDLSDEQVKAYRLVDNKTGEFADWDFDALTAELDEIEMSMEEFGFSEQLPDIDIDGIFEEHIDEYKGKDDATYLVWGNKKVEIDENDIEYLDNKYYEWESLEMGISFVSWLGGNT